MKIDSATIIVNEIDFVNCHNHIINYYEKKKEYKIAKPYKLRLAKYLQIKNNNHGKSDKETN